jgi:hypothetical protein
MLSPSAAATTGAASVPGAPTVGHPLAGNSSATVVFTVPPDGGSAITRFTVTPRFGKVAGSVLVVPAGQPGSAADPTPGALDHVVVGGLADGTAVTFTVSATNAAGTGASGKSPKTIPSTHPSTMTTVASSSPSGFFGFCVTFSASVLVGGGATPTGEVTFSGGGLALLVPIVPAPAGYGTASSGPVCTFDAGRHPVTATFGDPTGEQLPSHGRVVYTVLPDPTSVELSVNGGSTGGATGEPTFVFGSGSVVVRVVTVGNQLAPAGSTTAATEVPTGKVTVTGTVDPEPLVLKLVGGSATVPAKWLTAQGGIGEYQLSASYLGSKNSAPSATAVPVALSVQQVATQLAVSVTPASTSTTLTAALSPNLVGGVRAGGPVTFLARTIETAQWTVVGVAQLSKTGTATVTVAGATLGADSVFSASFDGGASLMSALFQDLLARSPSPSELTFYTNQLELGSTASDVASELLATAEYRADLVGGYIERFLGRTASPSDISFFSGELGSGATDENVIAQIVGSTEYFTKAGGTDPAFVGAAYHSLLARSPSSSELGAWVTQMGLGTTATDVANALLGTTEYRDYLVGGFIPRFLGRTASPSDFSFYSGELGSGATDENVIAQIVGSTEYAARAGSVEFAPTTSAPVPGPGVSAFVQHVFVQLLARSPSPSELTLYANQLALGSTASDVATELLTTTEYRDDLVGGYIERFLGRTASPGDISFFSGLLGSGATDEEVIADIVGSAEYFNDAGGTDTGFVDAAYQSLLGRLPSSSELNSWVTQMGGGTTATEVAGDLLGTAEYRGDLVGAFVERFLGRAATSSDISFFSGELGSGATDENVIAQIVGSAEYLAHLS